MRRASSVAASRDSTISRAISLLRAHWPRRSIIALRRLRRDLLDSRIEGLGYEAAHALFQAGGGG